MDPSPQHPTIPVASWVVYQAAFESLIRAVHPELTPALMASLKTATGYDVEHPRREYPPDTLVKVITFLAEQCMPHWRTDDAYEELGRRGLEAYRTTMAGRVVLAALKTATIPKALKLYGQGIATATNFTMYEVVESGSNTVTFRAYNSVSPPRYVAGMLATLLAACGHQTSAITFDATHAPAQTDYFLTW